MDDAEDCRDRVDVLVCRGVQDPVEDVEEAVAAKGHEVVGIEHCWDGGLAEQEELGEHADGFEDDAEAPEDLLLIDQWYPITPADRNNPTSPIDVPLHPLKTSVTTGAPTKLPPKLPVVIFHAFSFSLVRGNQRIIIHTTYTLLAI